VARSCLLVNSQVLLDAQIGEKGVPCQSRGDLESLRQYGSNCQVEYGTVRLSLLVSKTISAGHVASRHEGGICDLRLVREDPL
jgi:hypothetical protein